jgi:hypothetical protein
LSKRVIEGEFEDTEGAESVGFFHGGSSFVPKRGNVYTVEPGLPHRAIV